MFLYTFSSKSIFKGPSLPDALSLCDQCQPTPMSEQRPGNFTGVESPVATKVTPRASPRPQSHPKSFNPLITIPQPVSQSTRPNWPRRWLGWAKVARTWLLNPMLNFGIFTRNQRTWQSQKLISRTWFVNSLSHVKEDIWYGDMIERSSRTHVTLLTLL